MQATVSKFSSTPHLTSAITLSIIYQFRSRTDNDTGGLSAGLVGEEDSALAAFGGAKTEVRGPRGAADAAALPTLGDAAGAHGGLDAADAVAAHGAGVCRQEEDGTYIANEVVPAK